MTLSVWKAYQTAQAIRRNHMFLYGYDPFKNMNFTEIAKLIGCCTTTKDCSPPKIQEYVEPWRKR